jgi:hypothetical protein
MTSLSPYIRLCAQATPETLRRHPVTTSYIETFFAVAKRNGLPHARAWLLGRLLLDLHPHANTSPSVVLQQDPQLPPLDLDAPPSPRGRLQEHIEAASAVHANTNGPLV